MGHSHIYDIRIEGGRVMQMRTREEVLWLEQTSRLVYMYVQTCTRFLVQPALSTNFSYKMGDIDSGFTTLSAVIDVWNLLYFQVSNSKYIFRHVNYECAYKLRYRTRSFVRVSSAC